MIAYRGLGPTVTMRDRDGRLHPCPNDEHVYRAQAAGMVGPMELGESDAQRAERLALTPERVGVSASTSTLVAPPPGTWPESQDDFPPDDEVGKTVA